MCQLCGKNGHIALKFFKRFDVHFTGIDNTSNNVSAPPVVYIADVSDGNMTR